MTEGDKAIQAERHARAVDLFNAAGEAASRIAPPSGESDAESNMASRWPEDEPNPRLLSALVLQQRALQLGSPSAKSDELDKLIRDICESMNKRQSFLLEFDAVASIMKDAKRIQAESSQSPTEMTRWGELLDLASATYKRIKPMVLSQTASHAEAAAFIDQDPDFEIRELILRRGLELGRIFEDDCFEIVDAMDKQLVLSYLRRKADDKAVPALEEKVSWLKAQSKLLAAGAKSTKAKAEANRRMLPFLLLFAKAQVDAGLATKATKLFEESVDSAEAEFGANSIQYAETLL